MSFATDLSNKSRKIALHCYRFSRKIDLYKVILIVLYNMLKYIDLGNKKKIVNPCYEPREDDIIWEGKVSEFNFSGEGLNQKSNYEKIKSSLEEFGLVLSYIWVVKYTSYSQLLVKYLVKCENKNVFWYKYEGKTPGGGNNMLILNGTKIKTTKWIKMSHEEHSSALQACGL